MSEMDESDLGALISCPKALFSSFAPQHPDSNPLSFPSLKNEIFDEEDGYTHTDSDKSLDQYPIDSSFHAPAIVSRGSIAERRAAKCGFNADGINTARFRAKIIASRSTCVTIPPGISPAALLDSPIMLSNSQSSPTTGSFSSPEFDHENSMLNLTTPCGEGNRSNSGSLLRCKPNMTPIPLSQFPGLENQALGDPLRPSTIKLPSELLKDGATQSDGIRDLKIPNNGFVNVHRIRLQTDIEAIDGGGDDSNSGDQREEFPAAGMVRSSEDGYNWRKYGQKQVKGSEFPRSYYKCTNLNCLVRKKVERSHDGQITEIIYKGAHDHPKPQGSHHRSAAVTSGEMTEMMEGSVEAEAFKNMLAMSREMKGVSSDWHEGAEHSDHLSTTTHAKSVESDETGDLSCTPSSSHDDDEDGTTRGSFSPYDDADEDENESRKRKESWVVDTNMSSRAVREPRVVVQIETEVDILDDGYRWRKYGQKVVKGNPNPRSYYKCTSAGCSVKKHVERAFNDLKSVITAYEGKHNHEVPATRNSATTHPNSTTVGGVNLTPTGVTPPQQHPNGLKHQSTNLEDVVLHFERNSELCTEFLRTGYFGNFETPFYPQISYRPPYPIQTHVPDYPMPMHLGLLSPLSAFGSASVSASAANVVASPDFSGKPMMTPPPPHPPFMAASGSTDMMRFVRPKREHKDEAPPPYTTCLPIVDQLNATASVASSSATSRYCSMMGNSL